MLLKVEQVDGLTLQPDNLPLGPLGPVGPRRPVSPVRPAGPAGPVGPVGPCKITLPAGGAAAGRARAQLTLSIIEIKATEIIGKCLDIYYYDTINKNLNKSIIIMDTNLKNLIITSLGWLLSVVLTFGFLTFGQFYYYKTGYQKGQSDQFNLDVSRLEKNNYSIVPLSEISTFNGVVNFVKDSKLYFENTDRPSNPLFDPYPAQREVLIDEKTIIVQRTSRTGSAQPYIEEKVDQNALVNGQFVQVVSREPLSAYKRSFTADKLILNPNPLPPPPVDAGSARRPAR